MLPLPPQHILLVPNQRRLQGVHKLEGISSLCDLQSPKLLRTGVPRKHSTLLLLLGYSLHLLFLLFKQFYFQQISLAFLFLEPFLPSFLELPFDKRPQLSLKSPPYRFQLHLLYLLDGWL